MSSAVCLAINYADVAYFGFIEKRSSFDVFRLMGEQTDFSALLPLFLKDYWYLFLFFLINVFILAILYGYFEKRLLLSVQSKEKNLSIIYRFVIFLFVAFFSVLGMRGGLQLSPLSITHAAESVDGPLIPLALNSPFSIMKTYNLKGLQELNLMSDQLAETNFNPIKNPKPTSSFLNKNVVVIILESFSYEYTAYGRKKSYTPFLDSLSQKGLLFYKGYANGKRSIEGIPAILASMPSFGEPYVNSIHCGNKIESFASLLKRKGYHSSFFHGGKNGTMSFDAFCKISGFDFYSGLNEYPNADDYDGQWGIWDMPYLSQYVKELSKFPQPFFSSVFTLSSHHPFLLPEALKNKFAEGDLPIHKTIRYTDEALKNFFRDASHEPWFENTLFVITADHTGPSEDGYFSNSVGNYRIPILFYGKNVEFPKINNRLIQQVDLLPSVLHLLNYDLPYFSFGNNVFDSGAVPFVVNMHNNLHQIIQGDKLYQFNRDKILSYYELDKDSLLQNQIKGLKPTDSLIIRRFHSFLQVYQNRIVRNKTAIR